jgi:hypothetical protein
MSDLLNRSNVTALENLQPKEEWPLLAGEAIHNIRAALDHAVLRADPTKFRWMSQYPIFRGRPLVSTFVAIAMRAFECLVECETGQPISPGAQYPIYQAESP